MNESSFLRGLMIAFIVISLASFIVNGIVSLRDALISSGLLSGTITSTSIRHYTIDDVKRNLSRNGIINTTNRRVLIKDMGKSYLVTIYHIRKYRMENMTLEKMEVVDTMTIPKEKTIVIQSNYDFTPVVQLISALVAIFLLILVAEKLGIKL